jgi:hypothetical protein
MWKGNVPIFQAPDGEGTLQHWQQREMLIAVLHGHECPLCGPLEAELRGESAEWQGEHTGVVILRIPKSARADDDTADIRGALFDTLAPLGVAASEACLVASDRYGRMYAAIKAHGAPALQVIREAREWIDFIQEQCEECGAPLTWQ